LAGKRQALPGASGGTLGGIVAARGDVGRRDGWGGGLGVLAADWVAGEREALVSAIGVIVGARGDEGRRDGRCRSLGVLAADRAVRECEALTGATRDLVGARVEEGPRDGRCRRLGVPAAHWVAGERGVQVGALCGIVAAREGDGPYASLGTLAARWAAREPGFLARLVVGEWFGIGFVGREVMV